MPPLQRVAERSHLRDARGRVLDEEVIEHALQIVVADIEHGQWRWLRTGEPLAHLDRRRAGKWKASGEQKIERHRHRPDVVLDGNRSADVALWRMIRGDARGETHLHEQARARVT